MAVRFKPATRENVPILIGLAGGTGSGKTFSAMLLAQGLTKKPRFAVIDSESNRARLYADDFAFDHASLAAPFTAEKYTEAIQDADKAGYDVVIVDSASHEYAGEGGLLDQQEEELFRMAGDDWKKREACRMASWIKPKQRHKHFATKLLQVRPHLILCFRAEPKIEMARENGKTVVREKRGLIGHAGWFPSCEKNLPFEMTDYFLLLAEQPGVPHPIKILKHHLPIFPAGEVITAAAGVKLAEWSNSGSPGQVKPEQKTQEAGPRLAPEDDPLTDFIAAITDAVTVEELEKLGGELGGLDEVQRDELRPIYKTRHHELARKSA